MCVYLSWRRLPIKAVIAIRCQVLFELIVGLPYFPTEILELAVQRVLQAGRVVGVHYYYYHTRNGDEETIRGPQ